MGSLFDWLRTFVKDKGHKDVSEETEEKSPLLSELKYPDDQVESPLYRASLQEAAEQPEKQEELVPGGIEIFINAVQEASNDLTAVSVWLTQDGKLMVGFYAGMDRNGRKVKEIPPEALVPDSRGNITAVDVAKLVTLLQPDMQKASLERILRRVQDWRIPVKGAGQGFYPWNFFGKKFFFFKGEDGWYVRRVDKPSSDYPLPPCFWEGMDEFLLPAVLKHITNGEFIYTHYRTPELEKLCQPDTRKRLFRTQETTLFEKEGRYMSTERTCYLCRDGNLMFVDYTSHGNGYGSFPDPTYSYSFRMRYLSYGQFHDLLRQFAKEEDQKRYEGLQESNWQEFYGPNAVDGGVNEALRLFSLHEELPAFPSPDAWKDVEKALIQRHPEWEFLQRFTSSGLGGDTGFLWLFREKERNALVGIRAISYAGGPLRVDPPRIHVCEKPIPDGEEKLKTLLQELIWW